MINKRPNDFARQKKTGFVYEGITPYARVIDRELPKEKRIAAAWEIVEAIKSL